MVPSSSESISSLHLLPPELSKIVVAWPGLPTVVKVGILAMVKAAVQSKPGT